MIFESFMSFMNKIMLFSAYVNNASNFPKPLTIKEEKELFEKYWAGDTKAKDKLITHNLRLVAHIVKKYSTSGEADDMISVGSIGLIKAISTFKYDKNTQFSTYAARCIENEILMLLRLNKKHTQVLSLSDCLGHDKDGSEVSIIDIVQNEEEDVISHVENKILAEKLLDFVKKSLTDREYKIICMRFGLGNSPCYTQREIAKKLGISRSYISRLEKKAIDIMKEHVQYQDVFS